MEFDFDHEKLEVYQLAIQFASWTEVLVEDGKGKAASAKKHLDDASSSIPDNIAEGNGTWSKKERKKFFEVARVSALECASCLDVLVAKRRSSADRVIEGKKQLRSIVNVLTRMIKNLSEDSSQRKKRRLSCSCSCLLPPAPAPAPRVSISGRLFDARPERLRFCCPELNRARLTCPEMP